jgi:hypothetical protein
MGAMHWTCRAESSSAGVRTVAGRSLHVLLISGGTFMAQEEPQEIKELRSDMR